MRITGSPPCTVGNAMSIVSGGEVHGTLGCAEFDAAAVQAAAEILARGEPEVRTFHHDLGDVEVYLEPHGATPRLVVVSATDVARSLRAEMARQGRDVVLLESRTERLTPEDEPSIRSLEDVRLGPHRRGRVHRPRRARHRGHVEHTPSLAGRFHRGDGLPPPRRAVRRRASDPWVRRRRSRPHPQPPGPGPGRAPNPEEIALSIAAGLVAARHDREGGWLDR